MDSQQRGERKAVGLLVQLKHPDLGTFTQEYAVNLSPGGMFVRSRNPLAVGTRARFEVQIAGGVRVMRGLAEVRWTRAANDPAGPPGMGLHFLELDAATRALVDTMLAARPESGTIPNVTGPVPIVAFGGPSAPGASSAPTPAHGTPSLRPPAARPPAVAPPQRPATAAPPSAPRAPAVPPAPPRPPAAPTPPPVDDLGLDIEFEPPVEVAPLPPAASPAATDVDISFADLLAGTPAPISPSEEPAPLELELDVGGADDGEEEVPIAMGAPATLEPDAEPPLALGTVEPAEEELPLELEPEAEAPPPPSTPDWLDTGSPSRGGGTPAAPEALPTIRRGAAPAAPAAPETPQVLTQAEARPQQRPAQRLNPILHPAFLPPPQPIAGVGTVIGIDLGTTNSCVALLQQNRPAILRSKDGYNTIPSVVSLTPQGKLLVGHRAKSQLLLNPKNTIVGAKRLVGRPFDSAVVQQVRERFHYEICPDAGNRASVALGEHVLALEEVQGIVLRECREMAEQHLGQKVERAVVTVPAYYSEPQREAVRKAGQLAGLKIERILNEPTAAALAYGLNRELNKRVLVYDLGGGTFDATVLRIEKNVFEVMATGGDTFLGGVDFDNLLTDLLLQRFQDIEGVQFQGDAVALSRVTDAAERAKMALSERASVEVHVPMLMMDSRGRPHDLRCTVTREEFNAIAEPLIQRTLDAVSDVLLDAKLRTLDVDDVILVGGMSRMPLVREKLKAFFGKVPQASVNADEAVALGAALYSGTVDKVSSVVLIDVLPMTVGVAMPGGAFKRVVERNTPLPAQRSFSVSTARDNETVLELSVFQGEDPHVAGNEYLGTVRMEGLPRAPKGAVKVAVTLKLDAECVLHVEALEMTTRKQVRASLATRYSSEELQKQLGFNADARHKAEEKRAAELEERGGKFWGFLKKAFGKKA